MVPQNTMKELFKQKLILKYSCQEKLVLMLWIFFTRLWVISWLVSVDLAVHWKIMAKEPGKFIAPLFTLADTIFKTTQRLFVNTCFPQLSDHLELRVSQIHFRNWKCQCGILLAQFSYFRVYQRQNYIYRWSWWASGTCGTIFSCETLFKNKSMIRD